MDRHLGELAYPRGVSKGEMVRELVARGLEGTAVSSERSLVERLAERAADPSPPLRRSLLLRPMPIRLSRQKL